MWQERLQDEPMDFFVRELEDRLYEARRALAGFVGAAAEDLVFVENATYGMNVVAASVRLAPGDEVVLTDHEYGAVVRIWERACRRAGARIVTARLPPPADGTAATVDALLRAVTPRTKLIVFSHVTSPTALMLPAEEICRRARGAGVPTCVDGPHALATLDLNLPALDCDYYLASCHKWLSAPFGSGLLYVHPRAQASIEPPVLSWGRIQPAKPTTWADEFTWLGTRDPSAYLAVPAAIAFLRSVGLESYRARTRSLIDYARHRIVEWTGQEAAAPDQFVSMLALPLPPGEAAPLQKVLFQRFGIEIPILEANGRRWLRVSCHLYNCRADIDLLVEGLRAVV
jgi:isopenicillin-N epimerase